MHPAAARCLQVPSRTLSKHPAYPPNRRNHRHKSAALDSRVGLKQVGELTAGPGRCPLAAIGKKQDDANHGKARRRIVASAPGRSNNENGWMKMSREFSADRQIHHFRLFPVLRTPMR